jgi:F-box and leucine-rich repeat protein GRR1
LAIADRGLEFTEHQRNVFCVFSGNGVTGLRHHLNQLDTPGAVGSADDYLPQMASDGDDDQTMTGMMAGTALNADDEADGDEELDDGDVGGASTGPGNGDFHTLFRGAEGAT